MKEITDIIAAYDRAVAAGKACALATVVRVEGSSYRRPGARMLVTEDGNITGAISGGCLEGDALRKALQAITEGRNRLVTYDTTDEDDAKFGIQLGCNGIVHILFEPLDASAPSHPLQLLKAATLYRRPAVITTLFSLENRTLQPGTLFFNSAQENEAAASGEFLTPEIAEGATDALLEEMSRVSAYEKMNALHQYIPPPVALLIGGAGNDVMPLVTIAHLLGWEVTLVDGRASHASRQRFPKVKNIIVAKPGAVLEQVAVDSCTVCVLMSHNYNYDLALLKELLATETPYIGILGPKTKMDRMYTDLEQEGIIVDDRQRIYSPVGLDIGAETAEEIALSITAEIKAVLTRRNAEMLRGKKAAVHA